MPHEPKPDLERKVERYKMQIRWFAIFLTGYPTLVVFSISRFYGLAPASMFDWAIAALTATAALLSVIGLLRFRSELAELESSKS